MTPPRTAGRRAARAAFSINVHRAGGGPEILEIRLRDPRTRNALGFATLVGLCDAVRDAGPRPILLAADGLAFCSGLNLRELTAARSPVAHLRRLVDLLQALSRHPRRVITVIAGPARGAGAALAWCTDVACVVRGSDFAIPWSPGYRPLARVLLPLIAARRGMGRKSLATLVGRRISVDEALATGLVDMVCEKSAARQEIPDLLDRCSDIGPLDERVAPRCRSSVFQEMRRLAALAGAPRARAALARFLAGWG